MLAAVILFVEICSIGILYGIEIAKKRNTDVFFQQFILTKIFTISFQQKNPYLAGGKQKFIGNLTFTSGDKWRKLLPADSIFGWRNGKSIAATHYGKYIYVTNEQGFFSTGKPDFYYSRKKPPDVFRVIVVGGSTVMGQGAFTPKENLPAQILFYLKKTNPDKKNEVINAGVGGYASGQELLYIMSELIYYGPDLIIVYDGVNDQSYNNLIINRYEDVLVPLKTDTHYMLDERLDRSYTVLGSLNIFLCSTAVSIKQNLEEFAFWHLLNRIILKTKTSLRKNSNIMDKSWAYYPRSVDMYQENLERMILLSKYHGFKIALFLQPLMGIDNKTMTPEENYFNDLTEDLNVRVSFYNDARLMFNKLKEKHYTKGQVCVEDLSRSLQYVKETIYADSAHLTLRGNQIVAQKIVESLKQSNLFE